MAKTDDALKSAVDAGIRDSVAYLGGRVAEERARALDYYHGKPFGNEVDGRSSVVLTDVADTVEWILPSIIKIFTSGDKVVSFNPVGPEDVPAAEQETEVVNHVWNQQNPGFLTFHTWFKDALLCKNGVVKVWWDTTEDQRTERYRDITDDAFAKVMADNPDAVVEDHETETAEAVGPMGEPIVETRHSLALRIKKKRDKVCVEPVPPEEFLISRQSKSIREAPFCAHRKKVTLSDIRALGYSTKGLEDADAEDGDLSQERTSRFEDEGWSANNRPENLDKSMRQIWLHECYIRFDYDGDGIAELRKVTTAGGDNVLLDNEEVEVAPFASVTPVPMPHKWVGVSIADLVMDLQFIRSTLLRQVLDNLYLVNNARTEVVEGQVELDDLLTSRPGGIVRTKAPGMMREIAVPPVFQHAIPVMEYLEGVKENRTGVTKYNQGLDANSLNKTATGVSQIMSAAQQRIELIARIFAETGVKDAFALVHKCLRQYAGKAMTLRLRDSWIEVDPRQWKDRTDLTISVGLGTGNKDAMLGHLNAILQIQAQAVQFQGGAHGPLVTLKNLYNTASKIIENAGLKTPELYFTDPETMPPPPPKQDPEMVKAQMQMQLEQAKAQAQLQFKREEAAVNAQSEQAKARQDMEIEAMKARAEIELERQRMMAEIAIEQERARAKMEVEAVTASVKAQHDHMRSMMDGVREDRRMAMEGQRAESGDAMNRQMGTIAESMARAVERLSQPRKVKRDESGRVAGLE